MLRTLQLIFDRAYAAQHIRRFAERKSAKIGKIIACNDEHLEFTRRFCCEQIELPSSVRHALIEIRLE